MKSMMMMAAQVAQADLAHDFLDGVHVGLDDGVFDGVWSATYFPVFTSIAPAPSV